MIKKTIPILLVVLLFGQCPSWAAAVDIDALIERHMTGLVDMERVFQYDYLRYQEETEEQKVTEILEHHNAVHAVMALGLMDTLDDGTFGEKEAVPLKTFAKIIMQLSTGSVKELEEGYELYPDTRYTTYNEAAYYLVGLTGHSVYENMRSGDNPRSQIARQSGMLKGVDFVGDKNINRGDLAQMIFNALVTDMVVQTVYGDVEKFEKIPGQNLLGEVFDASVVYGMVTAQNGLNLYTEKPLEEDTISIDRVAYKLNGYSLGDVLGYQVQAVVYRDTKGQGSILGLTIDENDETIALPLDEYVYVNNQYLYYTQNGKEKKKNLSAFDSLVVNDMAVSVSQFATLLGAAQGEIRLSKPQRHGDYTMAVVRNWSSFVVDRVSVMDEKIYLDYGAVYNGNSYIDANYTKDVHIQRNGNSIRLEEVSAGSVIDVIESKNGEALTISVSEAKISGKISELTNNTVVINDKQYYVSTYYRKAQEHEPTLPKLDAGRNGTFLLNSSGQIVGYTPSDDSYTLGLLKEFGTTGGKLTFAVFARIYTEDNEWKELEFSDSITLDGVSGIKAQDAYSILDRERERICYAPVRFSLNSQGKLIFLDTAIVNDEEENNPDCIKKAASYSGEINWTSSAKSQWSGLTDSKYFYTQSTKFITIPRDLSKEDEYSIGNTSYLSDGMDVTMDLYNADDFFGVGIIVRVGSATSVATIENNYSWLVFTGLSKVLGDDGEAVTVINGYDGSSGKFVQNSFTLNNSELVAQAYTFTEGDLIHFSADGKTMLEMRLWCEVENLGTDISDDTSTQAMEGLGTVLDVDPSRNIVKVVVNGRETTWRIHCLGLFELEKNEGQVITPGDICPGDRVFGLGGFNFMRTLIIR